MQAATIKLQPFEIASMARDMAYRGLGAEDITAKLDIDWKAAWRIVCEAEEMLRKERGL